MCKFFCCTSAAMLAVLMTVDAFAARPRGGARGRPGPAVSRPANPAPQVAPPAAGNFNPAVAPNQSTQVRPTRPTPRNAHPAPHNAPHAAHHPAPHHGYNPNLNPKPFTPAWYAHHPGAWWATHPVRPWGVVTWVGLSRWVGLDTTPVIYDYGYDGSEATIVYGDETDATNPFAADQTAADVQADQTETEWYPLGMFSLIPPGNSDGIAVLQLAIGKDGAIRGSYHDVLTDGVYPLKGSLHKQTQKVSWSLDANKAIVYETGLHNLTEPETALMVRFGDRKKQKWTMHRMNFEEPEQQ